mgnify:FL=1
MKKVDTVDVDGIPVCVVTYSSGLTENSITFEGRCVDFSNDEIQSVIDGLGDKPYPMSNRDIVDYYFSRATHASNLKLCETVLADAGVLESSGALKQDVESAFDEARLARIKSEFGENWIFEAAALYVFRNFDTYSLEFYAASSLYEYYILDSPFRAGYIASEMILKFNYEDSAIQGQKNKVALQAAEEAKPTKAKARKKQKLELVAKLWHEQKAEHGANAMHKDTNAAHAIYAKAQEHNYPELQIKKSGQLIGPDSIKRLLPELREQGEIG